ncbi:MAG: DNA N-6-adenine-methyltransferase [Planctomycetota bacterium]
MLDGRNRLEICTRLGIPFHVQARNFESRADAELWVIENQLGRRNLPDIDRIALAVRREPLIRAQAAANQGTRRDLPQNSAEGFESVETREAAACVADVSRDTYSKGKRILEQGVPELVQAVREGIASIHTAAAIASLPADEQRRALADGDPVTAAKKVRGHQTKATGNPEWYTPQPYIEAARDVLGAIDLDPASNRTAQAHVQAACFCTAEQDGLAQPWSGRMWCNPPYEHPLIKRFVRKLVTEFESGAVSAAVLLVKQRDRHGLVAPRS